LLAAAAPGCARKPSLRPRLTRNPRHRPLASCAADRKTGNTGGEKSPRQNPQHPKWRKAPKPAKPVETAVNPDAAKEGEDAKAARRDPFESLVARQQAQKNISEKLPPGKAGLQVSTLRLDGMLKLPTA